MDIVKIDRTTMQEYLPMLTNRGVFSNYNNLPMKDEILAKEKERLSVDKLTEKEEREILTKVGYYKTKAYVVRDYGDYVIGFSAKMYLDNLNNTEMDLKEEVLKDQYGEAKIQEALSKINTYKLAHKLSIIILGEVHKQKKHEGIIISKKTLVDALGYETSEKQIYADIREAITSLRWLDYIIYKYNTKLKLKNESRTTGNFIYNLSENAVEYKLWVNPLFVGCVIQMMSDNTGLSSEEKKELLNRGYVNYPLDHIKKTREISDGAYFLGNYMLTQNGNPKLNTKTNKVISVSYDKLISESKISHTREYDKTRKLINALNEIDFIEKITPSIENLQLMSTKQIKSQTFRIFIPKESENE